MDGQTFDRVTKAFTSAATRRAALLVLLSALLTLLSPGVEVAARKNRRRRRARGRQGTSRRKVQAEKKGKKRKSKKKGKKAKKNKCKKRGNTWCGNRCIDHRRDANNCGGCGRVCAAPETCQNGVCTCPGGVLCDGECIAGGQCCDAGDCEVPGCHAVECIDNECAQTPLADDTLCDAGNGICCGGECLDPTSNQHCGRCHNACQANAVCTDGSTCNCVSDECGLVCCAQGERCCGGECLPGECCTSADCHDDEAPICDGNRCVACQGHAECSDAGKGDRCCAPQCVSGECCAATDCDLPPCTETTCDNHTCVYDQLPDGAPCSPGSENDMCCAGICVVDVECCDALQCASHPNAPICNAEGQCVACATSGDCPLPGQCQEATCSAAGTCGTAHVPDGPSETCPGGDCCQGTCCNSGEICYQGGCCDPPTECPADFCGIYHGNCGVEVDCSDTCTGAFTCCGERCLDLFVDSSNCGACGHTCDEAAGEVCSDGHCAIECGLDYCAVDSPEPDCCDSHCTNTRLDAENCGECGTICNLPQALTRCLNGICAIRGCHAGYANCDGQTDTGCETNTHTDPNHCGACENACAGGEICLVGVCVLPLWATQTAFGSNGAGDSEFDAPRGVAVSRDGLTALVADTFNHRISVWGRSGANTTDWTNQTFFGSGPGSGASELWTPSAVAVSEDGLTAFIADTSNCRVSVWTRGSGTSTDWTNQATFGSRGPDADQFEFPEGVAVTTDNRTVLVADQGNDRVSVWTRSSDTSTDWANQATFGSDGPTTHQFGLPGEVFVTIDGLTAFVADSDKERIAVWTRGTGSSGDWGYQASFGAFGSGAGQFDIPKSVAVAEDGLTAFVADAGLNRISVWTRDSASSVDWTNRTLFGSTGAGADQFDFPSGVVVSGDGLTALIADTNNHRIAVWRRLQE